MKKVELTKPQEETLVYAINSYLDYIEGEEGVGREVNMMLKVLDKLEAERKSC